jgi:hypothetical protein
MTAVRDPERVLRSLIEEGPTQLSERSYHAIRSEIDHTRQRVVLGPWREPQMTNFTRIAIAAVAALAVAVVAFNMLPRNANIVGPINTPGHAATTVPATPVAPPTPTPAPSITDVIEVNDTTRELPAGAYRAGDAFELPLSFVIPDGFAVRDFQQGDLGLNSFSSTSDNSAANVDFVIVNAVYEDPCHTATGHPPPTAGPGVDGLVTAITNQQGFTAGPVTDVVVGGASGKTFELINDIDTDTADCTGGPMLWQWTYPTASGETLFGTNGGTRQRIWVLSVNDRVLLATVMTFPWTTEAEKQTADAIIDTVGF